MSIATTHREETKETVARKVSDAITELSFRDIVLATVLRTSPLYVVHDEHTTAFTDGEGVYIGEKFAEDKSIHLPFVLGHEAYHMILGHPLHQTQLRDYAEKHFKRYGDTVVEIMKTLTPTIYNVVADAVVNDLLKRKGFPLPEGGVDLDIPKYSPASFIEVIMKSLGVELDNKTKKEINEIVKKNNSIEATYRILKMLAKILKQNLPRIKKPHGPIGIGDGAGGREGPVTPIDDVVPVGEGEKRTGNKKKTNVTGVPKKTPKEPVESRCPGSSRAGREGEKEKKKEGGGGRGKEKEGEEEEKGGGGRGEEERKKEEEGEGGERGGEGEEGGEGREGEEDERTRQYRERLKRLLDETITIARGTGIGLDPGELGRMIGEIQPRSVRELMKKIASLIQQRAYSVIEVPSWTKISKKTPGIRPGYVEYSPPKVWFLVDTSGSISDEILSKFIGVLADLLRKVVGLEVHLVPWDATVYEETVYKTPADLRKIREHLKGGGGTVIRPALEYVKKRMSPGDVLIIASDWMIDDIDSEETRKILRELTNKSLATALLTTGKEPPHTGKNIIIDTIPA